METNTAIGKKGENLACELLIGKGYSILHQNFRHSRREVDIIAQQDNLIIFVEVKLRKSTLYGYPEQTVTPTQQANIKAVAEEFLHTIEWKGDIRFDIIAIIQNKKQFEILHFEDAF